MDDDDVSYTSCTETKLHNTYACLKYTMFAVNLAIFSCGTVLLGLGVWIKYGSTSFVEIFGSYSERILGTVYLCIAVGCVMSLLGFLGWYGAYRENRAVLMLFMICMLLMFITSVAAAISVVAYSDSLDSTLKARGMKTLKEKYYARGTKGLVTESWDTVMSKFKCCGFFGYSDFASSTFSLKTSLKYPISCCRDQFYPQCNGKDISDQIIYKEGCYPIILEKLKKNSKVLGLASIFVTAMELSSMIVALVLYVKLE